MTQPGERAESPALDLGDGNHIPLLGFGVWQVPNGRECVQAVQTALEVGYRHIDTAQAYGNEESVGEALRRSGIPRQDVFITTKFLPSHENATTELENSLTRLGLEYVDLYLVHWPQGGATRAWPTMEEAHRLGYARAIGVSNFDVTELGEVFAVATIPPSVDQIQLNPSRYRQGLVGKARERGLVVEAYSPLGTGRHLADGTVRQIASRIGRTPAQVLLRWCVQHDFVVLSKSTHRDRIEENARIFDFVLTSDDMATLDSLDRTEGTDRAQEQKWW